MTDRRDGSPRVALLDVNLLVALFDGDHVHHELAHDWFADQRTHGWATCPITENGLVRVLSNPQYGSPVSSVSDLVGRLSTFRASGHHHFWQDEPSLTESELYRVDRIPGPRQLTDVYLLGLAKRRNGCLATFDRTIAAGAIKDLEPGTLQVITAANVL